MMRKAVVGFTILLFGFSAFPTLGQASGEWSKWAEGPVSFLMTDDEKEEWKSVSSEAEAERFEALFWSRRDPTPATPDNEFRRIFEQRVEFADQNFPEGNVRGAMTDRGMVIILLGVPTKMSRSQPRSTIQSGFAGSTENARGASLPSQMFIYEKKSMPPWMGGVEFDVEFVDYYGHNRYKLAQNPRRDVTPLLEKAVETFIVAPALDEPLTFGVASVATSFRSDALRQAWEDFRKSEDSGSSDLYLTWGRYVTASGESFVPVQLYVPEDASLAIDDEMTFFGVVEDSTGSIVSVYEESLALKESKAGLYVDRSLRLEPGSYEAVFGLASSDRPVAMTRTKLVVEPVEQGAAAVSELILSNDIHPLGALAAATDPFTFGGMKVVPKGDREFTPEDEIWYVLEVRHPELDASGNPNLQIKLDVTGETSDGTPVKMGAPTMPAPATAIQGKDGHFMVGSAFPAGVFKPGTYKLSVRLLDATTKKSWKMESAFTVSSELKSGV